MERHTVDSSMLRSVAYDADKHVLEVEFDNGNVYEYEGVPAGVYDELMTSDSKGRFFNQQIKRQYRPERIK